MNRNFSDFNRYLNILMADDYGQEVDPPNEGHNPMIKDVMHRWIKTMDCKSVLDVGCGAGAVAEPYFREFEIEYTGIALGLDSHKAQALGKNVLMMDMTFLGFPDKSFDLIFARHVVEHSPMPIMTLMEFERVAKSHLCLIVPNPEVYTRVGLNHYSVLYEDQWKFLAKRAGWSMIWEDLQTEPSEYRWMFEKKEYSAE